MHLLHDLCTLPSENHLHCLISLEGSPFFGWYSVMFNIIKDEKVGQVGIEH